MTNADKYNLTKEQVKQLVMEFIVFCTEKEEEFYLEQLNAGGKLDAFLNAPVHPTLTEDERVILRNIDKKFIYIKRGSNNHLYIIALDNGAIKLGFEEYDKLFQFIKERRRIRDSRTIERRIEMNMLKIMDYSNNLTEIPIDIDNLEGIFIIKIDVITGDEVCTVIYENGDIIKFDSSHSRLADFNDGEYILYNKKMGINLIDKFIKRQSSYDMWWTYGKDEAENE